MSFGADAGDGQRAALGHDDFVACRGQQIRLGVGRANVGIDFFARLAHPGDGGPQFVDLAAAHRGVANFEQYAGDLFVFRRGIQSLDDLRKVDRDFTEQAALRRPFRKRTFQLKYRQPCG